MDLNTEEGVIATVKEIVKCKFCHYWERTKATHGVPAPYGRCRFNPPVVLPNGETDWPMPFASDWCGKYAPSIAAFEEERATRINENGEEK